MPSSRERVRRRVAAARDQLQRASSTALVPPTLVVPGWKAKIYAAELNRLEEKYGTNNLDRRIVVDEARKKASPLHDYFDWDIRSAAMKHWLNQAGQLIRTVKVTYIDDPGPQRLKRAVVSVVRDDGQRKYTGILSALSSAEHRAVLIRRELMTIRGCKDRLKAYTEMTQALPRLLEFLEQAEATITSRRRRKVS